MEETTKGNDCIPELGIFCCNEHKEGKQCECLHWQFTPKRFICTKPNAVAYGYEVK